MDDVPYLMRGAVPVGTASSKLISSSKYLNHPMIRDWTVTESLRRNGRDLPFTYFIPDLIKALEEVQDKGRIDELFAQHRCKWVELDAWFTERAPCRLSMMLLASLPPESIGGILYRHLASKGLSLDIVPPYDTSSDYDYWRLRSVQYHDLHHILFGASFDQLGELTPDFVKLGSYYKFFEPELAGELTLLTSFLIMSLVPRTQLHYPELWPLVWRGMQLGMSIGQTSDAWFIARYEDYLHLPPTEARAALGIRNVEEIDTTEASLRWGEGRIY